MLAGQAALSSEGWLQAAAAADAAAVTLDTYARLSGQEEWQRAGRMKYVRSMVIKSRSRVNIIIIIIFIHDCAVGMFAVIFEPMPKLNICMQSGYLYKETRIVESILLCIVKIFPFGRES